MKQTIRRLYHFLGGVIFAIILILLTSALVIIGTFLESSSNSHQYAASKVYDTLLFSMLLWGFFINILFAALRRWPFQRRHIPFLITHLGLLMILGGVITKHYIGQQGVMFLIEGAATDQMMISNSQALRIDYKDSSAPVYLELPLSSPCDDLTRLHIAGHRVFPNSHENLTTFIKGNWLVTDKTFPLLIGSVDSFNLDGSVWSIGSKKGAIVADEIYHHYIHNTSLIIKNAVTSQILVEVPLVNALERVIDIENDRFETSLEISMNAEGFEVANLTVRSLQGELTVGLHGPGALANVLQNQQYRGAPVRVDLVSKPSLLFLEDGSENTTLLALGQHGDMQTKTFSQAAPGALYSFDQGFGGYAMQTSIAVADEDRESGERRLLNELKSELAQLPIKKESLTPPLQLIWEACQQANRDFSEVCVDYLSLWAKSGRWVLPSDIQLPKDLEEVFSRIDWSTVSERERKGCAWSAALCEGVDKDLTTGKLFVECLETNQWPFLKAIQHESKAEDQWAAFTRQLHSLVDELPPFPAGTLSPQKHASMISSFCRSYDIHLSTIQPTTLIELSAKTTLIECPLTTSHRVVAPLPKMEENKPLLMLELKHGGIVRHLALQFAPYGQGLKWPIPDGQAILRFQPLFSALPYKVRLRKAKQLTYPNSTQPCSYEAELTIENLKTRQLDHATVSMNNVYETWDGYRFYLSSMSPSDESGAKHIQLVINKDPAKYALTYPGAVILSLGIILLFWKKK